MSENSKKAAPKATDNSDDLLGDAQTPEQKAAADKASRSKGKKVSAAEKKKIEAEQDGNDYLPEENERHLVHVKMEKKVFSPSTGEKLTKDHIQKYNTKEWSAFQKNGGGLGFTCTVLWNPENYK